MNILPMKLPDIGEGVTEAELAEWHVQVGDIVQEDDVIAAVMTDKATVEIPSLYAGRITQLGGEIGQVLPVGSDLVLIETEAEGQGHAKSPAKAATDRGQQDRVQQDDEPQADPHPIDPAPEVLFRATRLRGQHSPVLAAPSVRARARDLGIDLGEVSGSGPAGRVTHADLESFRSAGVGPARSGTSQRHGSQDIKIIGLRRKIAERMAVANRHIPHITVIEEVDVTAIEKLRVKLNADRGDKTKLTVLPFVTAALARAVSDHPEMNAHYLEDEGLIRRQAAVHIGIATMTDAGLMVPVVRHAEARGLFDTAAEIARLSGAARDNSATREDLTGSTITVTSLGPLGALATTPIINHPEVAILGINKIAIRPMWDGSQFVPRQMMNISASFDHRVIDGWDAAVFVQRIKNLLETPALIFLEE